MRVADGVSSLELAEYQQAARAMLRHPLITASYPDKTSLPLVRKWASQLRQDFAELLGYTLVATGDTIRLRRVQDTLDSTRPALTRGRRPFDRRRYAYLVLTLSALGRSGSQIALSSMSGQPTRATNPPSEKQMPAIKAENRDNSNSRTSANMKHAARTWIMANQTL